MVTIRLIAVLLILGAGSAMSSDPTTNCDPLEGPVDAKACVGHWASERFPHDATFCTQSDAPCHDDIANKWRARAKIELGDRTFCSRLLRATFQYIDFETSTRFSTSETSAFVHAVTGEARLTRQDANIARVDIDNDRKPEVILEIFTAGPNYRSCDYPVYVQLQEDEEHLRQASLNSLMRSPSSCPVSFAPFRYQGKTYFEVRDWSLFARTGVKLLTQVFMINGEAREWVCEFSY